MLEFFRGRHAGLLAEIRDTGAMPAGGALESAADEFKRHFVELARRRRAEAGTADPSATDAEAPGEPTTPETLETE